MVQLASSKQEAEKWFKQTCQEGDKSVRTLSAEHFTPATAAL